MSKSNKKLIFSTAAARRFPKKKQGNNLKGEWKIFLKAYSKKTKQD